MSFRQFGGTQSLANANYIHTRTLTADDVVVVETLTVSGDVIMRGDVDICGDLVVAGEFDVSGDAVLRGNVDICGDLVIVGAISVSGETVYSGDFLIEGDLDVSGQLDVSGEVSIKADADISGILTVNYNPGILGNTFGAIQILSNGYTDIYMGYSDPLTDVYGYRINADVSETENNGIRFTGKSTPGGTYGIIPSMTLYDASASLSPTDFLYQKQGAEIRNLHVLRDSMLDGDLTIDGEMTISGDTIYRGDVDICGNLSVENGLDVSGLVSISVVDSSGAIRLYTAGGRDIYMGVSDAATDTYGYSINSNIGASANFGLEFIGRSDPGGGTNTTPSMIIYDASSSLGTGDFLYQKRGVAIENLNVTDDARIAGSLAINVAQDPSASIHIQSGTILMTNASSNDTTRPIGGGFVTNEIIGLSANALDAGQLRLSAGGGTNVGTKTYIDMYGFNTRSMMLGTGGQERMRLDASGHVGIGTTTPSTELEVAGDISCGILQADEIEIGTVGGVPLLVVDDTDKEFIVKQSGGAFTIQTTGAGNVYFCQDVGNVGIGTTTPSVKLEVAGDISCENINIETLNTETIDTGTDASATILADNGLTVLPKTAGQITGVSGNGYIGVENYPSTASQRARYGIASIGGDTLYNGTQVRGRGYIIGDFDDGAGYSFENQTFIEFVPSSTQTRGTMFGNMGTLESTRSGGVSKTDPVSAYVDGGTNGYGTIQLNGSGSATITVNGIGATDVVILGYLGGGVGDISAPLITINPGSNNFVITDGTNNAKYSYLVIPSKRLV